MKEKPVQNQNSESRTSDNLISDNEISKKSSKSTKNEPGRFDFLDLFGRTDFIWPTAMERKNFKGIRNRFFDTILKITI